MFMMPTMIKMWESLTGSLRPSEESAAETDRRYYDTSSLSEQEEEIAMLSLARGDATEGSVFIIKSGQQEYFRIVPSKKDLPPQLKEGVGSLQFGRAIVQDLLENNLGNEIVAVAIPGCASSPLGTAAFGKQVARGLSKEGAAATEATVAAINAGQGLIDKHAEAASGAFLMAPMANFLNIFDKPLEAAAKLNSVAAKIYLRDLMESMAEAATLYALLEARLVYEQFPNMNMIVSHSKGNWSVLVALINVELNLADKVSVDRPIDIVSFGNPVDLPDMEDKLKKIFRYHQYFGDLDKLAHNCSWRAWMANFGDHPPMLDPRLPPFGDKTLEAREKPNEFKPIERAQNGEFKHDERVFKLTEHHVYPKKNQQEWEKEPENRFREWESHFDDVMKETRPYHMPVEKILQIIKEESRQCEA